MLPQGNAKAGHLVNASNVPYKVVAIFNDLTYITEYINNDFQSIHIIPMAKKSILYCGCINNENVYRYYTSDVKAIAGLKKLAITRYAKLTDITKKEDKHWSRIRWS